MPRFIFCYFLHFPNIISFLFCLPLSFPLRFHFIFFHAITEFELDLYVGDFQPVKPGKDPIFLSFSVWPVSILVLPQAHKSSFLKVELSNI